MARKNRTVPTLNEMAPTAPIVPTTTTPTTNTKDPRYIAIVMTPVLLKTIRASANGAPLGGFLRNIICEKLNVTLETTTRTRTRYVGMTPDQIKIAKTAARKTHAEETKIALAYYREKMAAEALKTAPTA